jgi:hypothetical protein
MTTMEGDRKMSRLIWDAEAMLKAWGGWRAFGKVSGAGYISRDADERFSGCADEHFGAALYVEGLEPACVVLARAFVVAEPALVHVYVKGCPKNKFDTVLLPGQSDVSRAIVCNLMIADYLQVLEARLQVEPYSPSGFQAETYRG